jgi:hypothetical protein
MSTPLAELFRALRSGLERLGVRWYLFGAQAAIVHGSARLTADVDVTVALADRSPEELVAALEAESFSLRVGPDADFVRRTRVLPFVHRPSGLPLDVVLAGPGIEERFLARAQVREVEDEPIPVVAAEDLLAMKVLSGRPKDLEDVAAVLAARLDTIDLRGLRRTLGDLEQVLDRGDLMPELERALQAVRKSRKR